MTTSVASASVHAVTPVPQLKMTGLPDFDTSAKLSRSAGTSASVVYVDPSCSLETSSDANGTFALPGACPDGRPGRG